MANPPPVQEPTVPGTKTPVPIDVILHPELYDTTGGGRGPTPPPTPTPLPQPTPEEMALVPTPPKTPTTPVTSIPGAGVTPSLTPATPAVTTSATTPTKGDIVIGANPTTNQVIVKDASGNVSLMPGTPQQVKEATAAVSGGGVYDKPYIFPTSETIGSGITVSYVNPITAKVIGTNPTDSKILFQDAQGRQEWAIASKDIVQNSTNLLKMEKCPIQINEFHPERDNPCWRCPYRARSADDWVNVCLLDEDKCPKEEKNGS